MVVLAALVGACSGGGAPASPGSSLLPASSFDATVAEQGPPLDAAASDAPDASSQAMTRDAELEATPLNDASTLRRGAFCTLPGSVIWTAQGPSIVPGADAASPDMTWLKVPPGFCAHYFAQVNHTRQLRFAPGGDLFVASPSTGTAGGQAASGLGAVLVLPDDDHDGVADSLVTFLPDADAGQPAISSTQGLMFANGYFYYEDVDTQQADRFYVRRVVYSRGDRHPSGTVERVTMLAPPAVPQSTIHWPKMLDIAQDGTIYVTNGSDQGQVCYSPGSPQSAPFGAIFKINSDGTISEVAKGFRNPIALRCEPNHDVCLAVELALDGSGGVGREKIVPVRQGDDWGFPCCATRDEPYSGTLYADTHGVPDCSGITPETVSFVIGHTPFGIDFEMGLWPAPWTGRAFVVLHGEFGGGWEGARAVGIALDPATGDLLPASELYSDAATANNLLDFATGWYDPGTGQATGHGRPAAIAFAPDGRMFIGDDWSGVIAWIAPVGLMPQ